MILISVWRTVEREVLIVVHLHSGVIWSFGGFRAVRRIL
jgi:hypothetical protein